jgi:hypothetical protein
MKTCATSRLTALVLATVGLTSAIGPAAASGSPYLPRFSTLATVSSAVPGTGPAKGDVNPYGVAVVKRSSGRLVKGDVLVSNFNDGGNQQGTGASIVEISPSGHRGRHQRFLGHDRGRPR